MLKSTDQPLPPAIGLLCLVPLSKGSRQTEAPSHQNRHSVKRIDCILFINPVKYVPAIYA